MSLSGLLFDVEIGQHNDDILTKITTNSSIPLKLHTLVILTKETYVRIVSTI